ncbi:hypothetical protein Tco_0302938 [Tanacetum coccineum]
MGSRENGVTSSSRGSGNGAKVDKEVDFANYFCTYAFLYHQKEMLSDRVRMDAYFNSVFNNKHHFLGKVGLHLGEEERVLVGIQMVFLKLHPHPLLVEPT